PRSAYPRRPRARLRARPGHRALASAMQDPTFTRVLLVAALALCAVPIHAVGDDGALAAELRDVQKRLDDERAQWREFRVHAESAEERAALADAFPRDEFAGQLRALAERARGTDVAARAWLEIERLGVMLDDRTLFAQGVERLVADHAASPLIGGLVLDLVYGAPAWSAPTAAGALRTIAARN